MFLKVQNEISETISLNKKRGWGGRDDTYITYAVVFLWWCDGCASRSKHFSSQQPERINALDVCHVLWPAAVEVLPAENVMWCMTDSTDRTPLYIEQMIALSCTLSPPYGHVQMCVVQTRTCLTRGKKKERKTTLPPYGDKNPRYDGRQRGKSDAAESPWTLAALSIEMKWDGKLPFIQCYPGHCPRRLWWSASYFIWAGNRVPLSPAEACVSHLIPLILSLYCRFVLTLV